MKKNLFYVGVLLLSTSLFAQVGINTDTPEASLEIAKDANEPDGFTNGGLILGYPGENKNELGELNVLPAILELLNQQVLVRDAASGKVNHIDRSALNYAPIRRSTDDPLNKGVYTQDNTILVRGDITLPTGNEYIGKVIHLVYDSQAEIPYEISGPIKDNSFLTTNTAGSIDPNHKLFISHTRSAYTLQYGNSGYWYVIGGMERHYFASTEMVTLYDGGTIKRDDKYVLVKGNLTLPAKTANSGVRPVNGNLITLAFNGSIGTEEYTVTAGADTYIDIGGGPVNFITLKNDTNMRTYKLYYDGSTDTWRLPDAHARR